MSRCCRVLLVVLVALGVAAPSAGAAPVNDVGSSLGVLWKTALAIPTPHNPFTEANPPNDLCADLGGGVVAPFAGTRPTGTAINFTCTVKAGTRILTFFWTSECSSFPNDHGTFGTTEDQLRKCVQKQDAGITGTITINDQRVQTHQAESGLVPVHLPEDNIFGVTGAEQEGQLVAHGFAFLTDPLAPGTYTIEGTVRFPGPPGGANNSFTTTIIVQ
jgi:hypothetical protein